MTLFLRLFTLFIYITFLYELVGIPVPSIASTYQLFFTKDDFADNSLLAKVRDWPLSLKFLCLALPTSFVVLIYLLPLAQAIWPSLVQFLHFVPLSADWVLLVGMLLALAGRYVGLTAAWQMHHYQPEPSDDFSLKTSGTFAFTRNPILVGMYLTFVGLWLLYPSWEMGLGFLLFVANMHFRVLLEEDFLAWRFGEPYREFKAKTRRYF